MRHRVLRTADAQGEPLRNWTPYGAPEEPGRRAGHSRHRHISPSRALVAGVRT